MPSYFFPTSLWTTYGALIIPRQFPDLLDLFFVQGLKNSSGWTRKRNFESNAEYNNMPYDENKRKNGTYWSQCDQCGVEFWRHVKQLYKMRRRKTKLTFCSISCGSKNRITQIECQCNQCNKTFTRVQSLVLRGEDKFCSRSCAATYNNTHKKHGTRRSKLEVWLEEQLPKKYPKLEFHFNRKDTINSELDIYIPSLKLAFELNGIFHYEPIYGKEKLARIENNDNRKFQACIEKNIELCTIDVSQLKYFKPKNAQKYLDVITSIISSKKL